MDRISFETLLISDVNQEAMDSQTDSFVPTVICAGLIAGAGLFCAGSILPTPFRGQIRFLATGIAIITAGMAMVLLEKTLTALAIAVVSAGALFLSKQHEHEPMSAPVSNKGFFVIAAFKNLVFLLLCGLLVFYVSREIDRKEPLSADWALRVEWMKAASFLAAAGLFGVFAEPIFPGNWEKWSSRFNSTSFILLGGTLIIAMRPTEIEDEIYDCLGFLIILFQIGVGKNLIAALSNYSGRIISDPEVKSVEMTDLKF